MSAGILLAQQWSSQQLFWAAALPAIVSTITIATMGLLIGRRLGRRVGPVKAEEVTLAH